MIKITYTETDDSPSTFESYHSIPSAHVLLCFRESAEVDRNVSVESILVGDVICVGKGKPMKVSAIDPDWQGGE